MQRPSIREVLRTMPYSFACAFIARLIVRVDWPFLQEQISFLGLSLLLMIVGRIAWLIALDWIYTGEPWI